MAGIDPQRLRRLMEYEAARSAPPADFPALPPTLAAFTAACREWRKAMEFLSQKKASRYCDPAFCELEKSALFRKCWLLAAHLDELPCAGAFLRWEMAGVPVVLVRDASDSVHALVNRCVHRGSPVVMEASGQALL